MVLAAPTIAHSTLALQLSPVHTSGIAPWLESEDVIAAEGQSTGKQCAHQDVAVPPSSGPLRITTEGAANLKPDFDPIMLSTIARAVDHRAGSHGNRSHQGDRIPAHHQAWQITQVPDGDQVATIRQGQQGYVVGCGRPQRSELQNSDECKAPLRTSPQESPRLRQTSRSVRQTSRVAPDGARRPAARGSGSRCHAPPRR